MFRPDQIHGMSWIESVLYFEGLQVTQKTSCFSGLNHQEILKAKSDSVTEPISEAGLEDLWQKMLQLEASELILTPYGGRMSEISASETPFQHRKGNLFEIQYLVFWNDDKETEKNIGWLRRLYASMAPYVSKSPRAAYMNYRDLDLGRNKESIQAMQKQAFGV
ncbi:berberine bridge enzyme-like 13 [Prunus yedoensis var. nudiflora]|uniref:Berberine bridge enzyme-like 13 n=1 Tax=Prunus yedoensis var. nudiflora TaxID=2094558 RepID=A0A314ZQW0_PRUYE|nr:berberine bridge enzyme-like 13 [Prunus yedoensis var. nudiflora]